MNNVASLYGIEVLTSKFCTERKSYQFKFPKTKRKRIQRKWAKRPCNLRDKEVPAAFLMQGKLLIHPDLQDKLEDLLREGKFNNNAK